MSEPPHLVFDFPNEAGGRERLSLNRPLEIFSTNRLGEVVPLLRRIEAALTPGRIAAGFLSYEAAPAFDPALETCALSALPLLWFGVYDRESVESSVAPLSPLQRDSLDERWLPNLAETDYLQRVGSIKEALAAGETYQANYTFRMRSEFSKDGFALYERLRENHDSAFCAFLDIGRFQILSASPELFFERCGAKIRTKPMKGTIKRGRWNEEDESFKQELLSSEKNRAENLMIVDLLRNDLGKISKSGSVRAEKLFEIETYPTLHTMTSTISSELEPGVDIVEIFRALFPCGSVTGAPKVSTMRLIRELEEEPRQVYCGAIGLMTSERAVFNVPIRTALIDKEKRIAEYGVGGGIVWDSVAKDEFAEALLKAKALTETNAPFELLEAILLQVGEFHLLERHLNRLEESARYFGFQFCREKTMKALQSLRDNLSDSLRRDRFKVRLSLSKKGLLSVEKTPIGSNSEDIQTVRLAGEPVDASDRFLFHKTSIRGMYSRHIDGFPECYDALLWNSEGELTEFTRGNVIVRLNGSDWTPPVSCGLLGGTMRAELIERGELRERIVTLSELRTAEKLFFVNSIRGVVPVKLLP